ncbi:enoyl-CoA hydratase/isomerase family protein [Pseudonocardia pini]|uniref:enoyl-CoA hydratase/isomerase family protein n=1 Tax=Pseudonocardia pini TaxID=2758030 RepID=UPI0015F001F6|nr:enoyl-CoA hydratase-related protein [Pseudonocardia pini]
MSGRIRVECAGPVATVVVDHPATHNAVTTAMVDDLGSALGGLAGDPDVRVVVVTGAGEDFCAGYHLADLGDGVEPAPEVPLASMRRGGAAALALHRLDVPVIAKVRGVAVGLGWNLALQCDLVVASDTARFTQRFTKLGLSVDFGGSHLLPRLVGTQRAKRLVYLSEWLSAAEAADLGLVAAVVPDAELDDLVADWAGRLAGADPHALSLSKRLLERSPGISMAAALEDEARAQALNVMHAAQVRPRG